MTEGWLDDEYLVLFSEAESATASAKYKLAQYLPGHTLLGLRGWDDFIVVNPTGTICSLPTVPLEAQSAVPFTLLTLSDLPSLEPDSRFAGKIKWYVKPLVFGGDPQDKSNMVWLTHEQHAEAVVWWNNRYQLLKAQGG